MDHGVEKSGVFISHISEEKEVASRLKSLLRNTFGKHFRVFVASDYRSIGGGELWFSRIINALQGVRVVLVLISDASVGEKWINFEAGVGLGANAKVIPLVIRGFSKGDVGQPLAELQMRDLHDPMDVDGLLKDIENQVAIEPHEHYAELFVEELIEIERRLPSDRVYLEPLIERQNQGSIYLLFNLVVAGSREVELIEIRVITPDRLRDPNWPPLAVPPALYSENKLIKNKNFLVRSYIAGKESTPGSPDYQPRFQPLRKVVSPSMSPLRLWELRFPIKENLSDEEKEESIFYEVYGTGGLYVKGEARLKDIGGFAN
ncbi:MAG: toll/interleukin-1 receptor domain-containing protein [Acidobacteriia bacterium]|nr:toll/interleukin-1 receptor domain-containing protein [Terriglobia bacterium]